MFCFYALGISCLGLLEGLPVKDSASLWSYSSAKFSGSRKHFAVLKKEAFWITVESARNPGAQRAN